MLRKNYQVIASKLQAIENCVISNNIEWHDKHLKDVSEIINHGPSGSDIDCGTKLDFEKSNGQKLVFDIAFHHMNDGGFYDGWTNHKLTITPSFDGFNMKLSGRDRNFIKDYLADTYSHWLNEDYEKEGK